jgi:hypothetical protein
MRRKQATSSEEEASSGIQFQACGFVQVEASRRIFAQSFVQASSIKQAL